MNSIYREEDALDMVDEALADLVSAKVDGFEASERLVNLSHGAPGREVNQVVHTIQTAGVIANEGLNEASIQRQTLDKAAPGPEQKRALAQRMMRIEKRLEGLVGQLDRQPRLDGDLGSKLANLRQRAIQANERIEIYRQQELGVPAITKLGQQHTVDNNTDRDHDLGHDLGM